MLIPAALSTVVGLAVLWPSEQQPRSSGLEQVVPEQTVDATVVGVRVVGCYDQSSEQCQQVDFQLTGPVSGRPAPSLEVNPGADQPRLRVGDEVRLARYVDAVGQEVYAFSDYQRTRSLLTLGMLTAIATVLVARWRGLAALVGVGVTAVGITSFIIPALLDGKDPLAVALAGSSALLFVILYLAHGLSSRTSAALVGTLSSLALCGLLSVAASSLTRITGLSSEDTVALQGFAAGVDVRELLICGFVIGALGALNDVTITQASAVWELHASDPAGGAREVYGRAMRIGRDHIASSVYTLVFAYAGAALPLLLIFSLLDRPTADVLTGDLIAVELVRTFVGTLGLLAAVPITTAVAALVVTSGGASPAGATGT